METITKLKKIEKGTYLEELGFTVLRFENKFVFQEPEFVLSEIRKTFQEKRLV